MGVGMLCIGYETATCFFHLTSNKELGLPSAIRDHLTSSSHQSMMPKVLLTLFYTWRSRGTEMNWLVQAIQLLRVRTRIWICVTQSYYPLHYMLPTWELVARGKRVHSIWYSRDLFPAYVYVSREVLQRNRIQMVPGLQMLTGEGGQHSLHHRVHLPTVY